MRIRVFSAGDVRSAVGMERAIARMKEAFAAVSSGRAEAPQRIALASGEGEGGLARRRGVTLFMPARIAEADGAAGGLGAKIVSVFPGNREAGRPVIHALVVMVDDATGAPEAILEGSGLTALRTGAASGAATDVLARADARTAAIFGAGVQGRTQLEAVCAVRRIVRARVFDPRPGAAEAFAEEMRARGGGIPRDLRPAATPEEAADGADVICTATTASRPILPDAAVRPGTHVNAVGSFTPEARELPGETIARAAVFVDSRAACAEEAGDLLIPLAEGRIGPDHVRAELGEVLLGRARGRASPDEVTVFKSVGLAVQDVAIAREVLEVSSAGVLLDL